MSHPSVATSSPAPLPNARSQLNAWAKPQASALRMAGLSGLADVICVVGFAWGLSHLVTGPFEGGQQLTFIAGPAMILLGSLSLRAILSIINQKLNLRISRDIIAGIRLGFMEKALAGRIDPPAHQERLNALFEDTEALEGYYARFRQASLQAVTIPLLLIVVAALKSPVSAGILTLTLLPFVALMALLGMSSADESKRQLDALSRLSNLFIDRLKALPLILSFDAGSRQTRLLQTAADDVATRTLRVLKIAFLTSAVLEFFSALSVALIAVYCGFYLLGQLPFKAPESLNLEAAFFVLALAPEIYAPMRRLSAAYHDRQAAMAAAQRLMAIDIAEPVAAGAILTAPTITYDNVTCGFPDDPGLHIGPVSFVARPDTITALSGPTGCGKTTSLRLLLGQGRVMDGKINVDGKNLNDVGDLAANIAWVSQNPPILAATLRDNLILANPMASDKEVEQAIETVGLCPLIESRDGGLLHVVDERGAGLSGGERKRIGLARAVLKNAPIWLLDEPTADLDAESEAELIAILPALFKDRTVILSSHSPRLNSLSTQTVNLA